MSYLIAVATSDELNVDLSFGEAEGFVIYEVDETEFSKKEYRPAPAAEEETSGAGALASENNENKEETEGGCGCGGGCGCSGHGASLPKVELVSDCRSLVCRKIGFQAQKQLEKKQISAFAVECSVEEALNKISSYFYKVDNHQSLRKLGS